MHGPQAIDRRERLRRLALETIDLSKDPYFMRNHLGQVCPAFTAASAQCTCSICLDVYIQHRLFHFQLLY